MAIRALLWGGEPAMYADMVQTGLMIDATGNDGWSPKTS